MRDGRCRVSSCSAADNLGLMFLSNSLAVLVGVVVVVGVGVGGGTAGSASGASAAGVRGGNDDVESECAGTLGFVSIMTLPPAPYFKRISGALQVPVLVCSG